jgi:K+-transporting ATPase ATPase C chain
MRSYLAGLRHLLAALRMLLIFTVICGIAYPLAITAIAQVPGLHSRADAGREVVLLAGTVGAVTRGTSGRRLVADTEPRPVLAAVGGGPAGAGGVVAGRPSRMRLPAPVAVIGLSP